jgi:hypothetical protein
MQACQNFLFFVLFLLEHKVPYMVHYWRTIVSTQQLSHIPILNIIDMYWDVSGKHIIFMSSRTKKRVSFFLPNEYFIKEIHWFCSAGYILHLYSNLPMLIWRKHSKWEITKVYGHVWILYNTGMRTCSIRFCNICHIQRIEFFNKYLY